MKQSSSRFLKIRGLDYHVREWGEPGRERLFLLHGWGDVAATFQFLVDALSDNWHVIAPDWRGFGQSVSGADSFWFPDYVADLEALLCHYQPEQPVKLVGHSLGGNVAEIYAGVRPARVSHVVALDAFGLSDRSADEAAGRLEKWLDQLAHPDGFRTYPDIDAFAARLMRGNPRLDRARAHYLASNLSRDDGNGGVVAAVEAAHRHVNPVLYRRAEAESIWRKVRARVCWIVQADPGWRRRLGVDDESYRRAAACFRDFTEVAVDDSGHNLHHDQPLRVAEHIERFLRALT